MAIIRKTNTTKWRTEVTYAITGLGPTQATNAQLTVFIRQGDDQQASQLVARSLETSRVRITDGVVARCAASNVPNRCRRRRQSIHPTERDPVYRRPRQRRARTGRRGPLRGLSLTPERGHPT